MTEFTAEDVELDALDAGLALLWEQAEQSEPKTPLCRTLTLNLIAVTDAGGESDLQDAISRMLLRHPCRAFSCVLASGPAGLRARLGTRLRREHRARQTVLEQIELRCDFDQIAKLPGLIRPLLVNDIPVALYWAMALPERAEMLDGLARLAARTVFNSTLFSDPAADCARLEQWCPDGWTDLVALRVRPWRRALAEAFERFTWSPGQETLVEIQHGPHALAAAVSLRRWLQQRLHAEVRTLPVAGAGSCDRETSVQPARLSLSHHGVVVKIIHDAAGGRLETEVTLPDRCLIPSFTPTSRGRVGDLLAAAVDG